MSVSSTYLGTFHNKTADVSSTVAVVLRQSKTGELQGCMQIKSPLYGSGTVQGTVRGTSVNFVVADITLHGDALKDAITGAYMDSQKNGQQVGDFRIERRKEGDPRYYCNGGTVTEVVVSKNSTRLPRTGPRWSLGANREKYAKRWLSITRKVTEATSED